MTESTYNIAVVGATGLVGQTLLSILEGETLPIKKVYALASQRSIGKKMPFRDGVLTVQDTEDFDFTQVKLAFFSAGASCSKQYVPKAVEAGCFVIDNTSHFRYDPEIPLIIPEVNVLKLKDIQKRRIVSNPNCSTIQMLIALNPLHQAIGIKRINVATYQSVSGLGRLGVETLKAQTMAFLKGEQITGNVFPRPIAFNVIPEIDVFEENGYTKEEMKMVWETQKILSDYNVLVNATAVRVPVFYGHSEALHVELKQPLTVKEARILMQNAPCVQLMHDEVQTYADPLTYAKGSDWVFVGRIRRDLSHPCGLNMWVVSDNLRKGAALNAVQIAKQLFKNQFYCQ